MKKANAIYKTKKWKRRPWDLETTIATNGLKYGRVEMLHRYEGDIEGEGVLQYLFFYNEDNNGGFVGLETVTGTIEGRSGSFILQITGTAQDGMLHQTLVVLPGSGTGELSTLRGQSTMECDLHMEEYPITLDYEL